MVRRSAQARLAFLQRIFPVVTVIGPRQCGKTTLVRGELPKWRCLDLEKPRDWNILTADPEGFFADNPKQVIIDESQRYPPLFPFLRHVVDLDRRPGRFVLTGSAQPSMIRQAGESLAGRVGILELTPFTAQELAARPAWLAQRWFWGGFPPLYQLRTAAAKREWLESYITTFLSQDLPGLGVTVAPARLRRFWSMAAHLHGQILSLSELARAMDLSYHTIAHYLDILEGAFVIRRLKPYHANVGKRLVKSPKLYIRDTGILHCLLGLRSPADLEGWPGIGASFEGLVVEELAVRMGIVGGGSMFYWRTQAGAEADLILEVGRKRLAVEIKTGQGLDPRRLAGLKSCMADLELRRGVVLYGGAERLKLGHGIEAIPWRDVERGGKIWPGVC
ncbi:MAG: ATP-binding protein [Elusimicrobia bacterium]|nr:ATP-binding protein [Elusimicrobiota bacterium]